MGYKVGIIPAAGQALRFGGVIKELLPLPDGRTLLEHAVDRLCHCDRIVVVSNASKVDKHIPKLLGKAGVVIQQGNEMWGAIQTAMVTYDADQYYLTMPDTWMMRRAFEGVPEVDFGYGYFITERPERFGCLMGNRFEDKPQFAYTPAVAWGVLTWSKHAKRMWLTKRPSDYTEAINFAIEQYNHTHWSIGPYFDCASIEDYEKLLRYLGKERK